MLKFFRRLKWYKRLQGCNYDTAKMLLAHQYEEQMHRTDFASRLDAFLADPCFDTAADLLDFNPKLIIYFEDSKPGGELDRLFRR